MTLNHGFPPPGSSLSSDDQGEKGSDCGAPMIDQTNGNTESITPPIHQEIREIKNKIDEMRSAQSATRVEQVFFFVLPMIFQFFYKYLKIFYKR